MDPLWILEADRGILASLEDTLRLSVEDDLLKLRWVNSQGGFLRRQCLVLDPVLEDTLLAGDSTTVVSVLLQLRQEPLKHLNEGCEVTARDLMREDNEGTLHLLETADNFL